MAFRIFSFLDNIFSERNKITLTSTFWIWFCIFYPLTDPAVVFNVFYGDIITIFVGDGGVITFIVVLAATKKIKSFMR